MKKAWLVALLFGVLCTGCDSLDEVKRFKTEIDRLNYELSNIKQKYAQAQAQISDIKQKYAQAQAQIEEDKRLYNQMLK